MEDILDYANRMNKNLNTITDLVYDTKNYFQCSSGDTFREQYDMMRVGIPNINKSILSYNADLMNVKQNYLRRQDGVVEILDNGQKHLANIVGKEKI